MIKTHVTSETVDSLYQLVPISVWKEKVH